MKEKLEQLYIIENKSTIELAEIFKVTPKTIRQWLKKYDITKSKELINIARQKARKKNNLEKYGVEHTSQLKENREKMKETCLEKFGVDNGAKAKVIKEKVKQNNLEKYGETNPLKVQEIKEKIRLGQIKKKGFAYPYQQYKDSTVVEILSTKENLENYLKSFENKPTIKILEKLFNYSHCAILSRIKELGLLELIEYYPEGSYSQRNIDKSIVEMVNTPSELENYLKSFENKPTLKELENLLGYDRTTLGQKVDQYNLRDYIKYGSTTSSYEKEINFLFNNIFKKNRKILYPKYEIDLFNEDHNLGIEFNGNYYHSIDNKGSNYHQDKSLLAIEKNIRLIHIFEYEWLDLSKKEKLLTLIKDIITDERDTLYARQCEIKEVSSEVAKKFLNNNHLQGADKASIRVGLFYKDLLVEIMTFCKPRFNKNFEWELSRLCSYSNFKIVGGADRLLKYFEKTYKPKNLVTYCDISKFTGEVYKKLGFTFSKISNPNYIWCNNKGNILTRYQCQKHKLVNQFPEYKDLSEDEIMYLLGYWKIEDSGNQVWIKEY